MPEADASLLLIIARVERVENILEYYNFVLLFISNTYINECPSAVFKVLVRDRRILMCRPGAAVIYMVELSGMDCHAGVSGSDDYYEVEGKNKN